MKTIGLIGGMSWESTVTYYQIVNEIVKKELGGLHSAQVILYSVEFDEIEKCQAAGEWEKSGEILGRAAKGLEAAGADFILICTNTMHKVFDQVQSYVKVSLLHIAQVTADTGCKYRRSEKVQDRLCKQNARIAQKSLFQSANDPRSAEAEQHNGDS